MFLVALKGTSASVAQFSVCSLVSQTPSLNSIWEIWPVYVIWNLKLTVLQYTISSISSTTYLVLLLSNHLYSVVIVITIDYFECPGRNKNQEPVADISGGVKDDCLYIQTSRVHSFRR